jgi:hypothetical protein
MSYHVFFSFSSGLAKTMRAPKGTRAAIWQHVEEVEKALNLKREKYKDNPVRWSSWERDWSKIGNEKLCEIIADHNDWVQEMYAKFAEWCAKSVSGGESITPKQSTEFWFGFERFKVPPSRWSEGYYRAQMERCYEVMRGRPTDGVGFDAKPLTEKQAAAVICLFSEYLDAHDLRLDVPNGYDYLASSYDGGYDWCEKCGPCHPDDWSSCRKRKCPLIAEYGED